LADALNIGNHPAVFAACNNASAIFANSTAVKVDGCTAVGAFFIVNRFVFCCKFAKGADESPAIGHKQFFVSVAADYISGAVIGYVIRDSGNNFYGDYIVLRIFCAADYICGKHRNPLHMVCLSALDISINLAFGSGVKFFCKMCADIRKVTGGPCILETDIKIGNVAEELGFVESGIARLKAGNIVNKRCRTLCGDIDKILDKSR